MSSSFEAQTVQVAAGRNWVVARALDNRVAAERVTVLKLLASEVITNAVVHGPPHGQVTVRVLAVDGHLRVEVDDEGTRPPLLRDPIAQSGVAGSCWSRLTPRAGAASYDDGGKAVWFQLPLSIASARSPPTRVQWAMCMTLHGRSWRPACSAARLVAMARPRRQRHVGSVFLEHRQVEIP